MPKFSLILIFTLCFTGCFCAQAAQNSKSISGSGSTSMGPVMTSWSRVYFRETGIKVNYQETGSGMGLTMLMDKSVDFAASDMPLSHRELTHKKLSQFPAVITPIDVVYNIPNIMGKVVLNGRVLGEIFLGNISYWDDAQIKKLNPNLKLPHKEIVVIHREDQSGTTYNFSNYLDKTSKDWHADDKVAFIDKWPAKSLGVQGNGGMVKVIKTMPYSIGYAAYIYAKEAGLNMAVLVNHDGFMVSPDRLSSYAAILNISSKQQFADLSNLPGTESWPIIQTIFVIYRHDKKSDAVKIFFKWCLSHGNVYASELNYVPIPKVFRKNIFNN